MGELYDRMARDLKLRNLAAATQKEYLRCCCGFVRYHMKSPRELGEAAIKEYLEHLLLRGAGPETLKMNVAGLKFLYGVTLDRPKVAERLLWPKVPHKKADILSGSEVLKLLGAVKSLVCAMVLATAYGAGLRISEACRVRVEDIDSKRGLIHVRLGKGGKDRYVMLSPRLLVALRRYLGRYTHRVGLSSHRLVSATDEAVTFRTWGEQTATLHPREFLRRFLLHVLPDGFVKMRHYGLMPRGTSTPGW